MDKETLYYYLSELENSEEAFEFWYKNVKFERVNNQIKIHFPDRILIIVLPPDIFSHRQIP